MGVARVWPARLGGGGMSRHSAKNMLLSTCMTKLEAMSRHFHTCSTETKFIIYVGIILAQDTVEEMGIYI